MDLRLVSGVVSDIQSQFELSDSGDRCGGFGGVHWAFVAGVL